MYKRDVHAHNIEVTTAVYSYVVRNE